MFGLKKDIGLLRDTLKKETGLLRDSIQKLMDGNEQRETKEREALSDGLQEIREKMGHMEETIGKHDMTIEDMLDEWEELHETQHREMESVQRQLMLKQEKELKDYAGRESALLDMTILAWDQIYTLRNAAEQAKDASWVQQLKMAENLLREKAIHLGVERTGTPGEPFSYDIHEPMMRVDTDDPGKDMTVAAVYTPGYWYRGNVYRKAQVEVYRMKNVEVEA